MLPIRLANYLYGLVLVQHSKERILVQYSKPGIRSTERSKSERFDAMRAARLSSCEIQLLRFVPESP